MPLTIPKQQLSCVFSYRTNEPTSTYALWFDAYHQEISRYVLMLVGQFTSCEPECIAEVSEKEMLKGAGGIANEGCFLKYSMLHESLN